MVEPRPDKITAPEVNFAYGLKTLEIPELGEKHSGKVRDWWNVPGTDLVVFVTSDRQSAFDVVVGAIPGKGKALNQTSAWWSKNTQDILPSDVVAVPHPNVKVARRAVETLPVEMVFRRFMAKSSTSTSVYENYRKGGRSIYGIDFPDGLQPNQAFPVDLGQKGVIFTPTTKASEGEHDEMLIEDAARELIKARFGSKIADQAVEAGYKLFQRAEEIHRTSGLLFIDTKYEMGIDSDGQLMLIDEINTSDSSRIWKANTYKQRLESGEQPESFDKEILRRWLAEKGFRGEEGQTVPIIPDEIREAMLAAYSAPYKMLSGKELSSVPSHPQVIRACVASCLNSLK